jgi:hypothetical protein
LLEEQLDPVTSLDIIDEYNRFTPDELEFEEDVDV